MVQSSEISTSAEILRAGGLVAIPTETVYGLGADARNPMAVARVFEVKNRPRFDPLIVHVPDRTVAEEYVTEFPAIAARLAEAFWPGPLTIVLPKREVIPDIVTAGLPSVAIRVPDHPFAQQLLREAGLPIAAPSANPFGRLSPTTAEHVRSQLGDAVDFILDGGPSRVGVESTVVQVRNGELLLLRPGGVTVEELEAVAGAVTIPAADSHPSTAAQPSPGTLPQHYAPGTPLFLDERDIPQRAGQRVGLLCLQAPADSELYANVEVLSASGDLREAAANFFAALRRLDEAGLDAIIANRFPDEGLGRALNDRLSRAAQ